MVAAALVFFLRFDVSDLDPAACCHDVFPNDFPGAFGITRFGPLDHIFRRRSRRPSPEARYRRKTFRGIGIVEMAFFFSGNLPRGRRLTGIVVRQKLERIFRVR